MPWMPLGVVMALTELMKEKDMANIDYDRSDCADCEKEAGQAVPSMAAYAQMVQQPQQHPQSAQDMLNQQINRQVQQAHDEMVLRAKQEHMRRMEQQAMEVAMMIPTRKQGVVKNVCAIQKAPEKRGNAALELMDALEYLIADVLGNVRRNPKLEGLDTNFAMRRAKSALEAARRSYRGPGE